MPIVTATFPVDRSCQYQEGSFPYFKGLADSVLYVLIFFLKSNICCNLLIYVDEIYRVMNGINAPKVVECLGSDGQKYKQLAKSGNDDLRQDAVRCVCVCVSAFKYKFSRKELPSCLMKVYCSE